MVCMELLSKTDFPLRRTALATAARRISRFGFASTSSSSASETQSSSSRAVFLIRQTRGAAPASEENSPTSMASRSESSASGSGPSRVLPPGSDAVSRLT